MKGISVVINTLNEEKNLPRALKSVKSFADEIIVVDMESDDDTRKIAKKAGAHVYKHKRMGYVEPARNYAISKAKGEWILILDADEMIPSSLATKLVSLSKNAKFSYFGIPRKNIIFSKWIKHANWWPDYNIRFFKKGAVSWGDEIHSIPVTRGKGSDLAAEEKYAITHFNYQTVSQYVERMNRYTSVQAKEKYQEGQKANWKNLISKPMAEFNRRYFAGYGYKDGIHGLALSSLQAFSELVLYLKLWELTKFKSRNLKQKEVSSEIKKAQQEVAFWRRDMLASSGVVARLKRKFKLL